MAAVTINSNNQDFKAKLEQKIKLIDQAIIRRLSYIGVKAVNRARSVGSYKDHTSNLRNSIGYVVVTHGKIVDTYFPNDTKSTVVDQGVPLDGAQTGQSFAESIAAEYLEGYALIVVAGMSYALNVESFNYDVLSSTKIQVMSTFKSQMDELIKNIKES